MNFWPYAARLKGAGYTPLISMSEVMKDLGISPMPSLVGYIWKEKTEAAKGEAISAFLGAARMANGVLASSDPAWDRIKGLVKPADDAEFAALKEYYRSGIPGPWRADETAAAEKLMKLLIDSGDKDLVGDGTRFDPKLFRVQDSLAVPRRASVLIGRVGWMALSLGAFVLLWAVAAWLVDSRKLPFRSRWRIRSPTRSRTAICCSTSA